MIINIIISEIFFKTFFERIVIWDFTIKWLVKALSRLDANSDFWIWQTLPDKQWLQLAHVPHGRHVSRGHFSTFSVSPWQAMSQESFRSHVRLFRFSILIIILQYIPHNLVVYKLEKILVSRATL